MNTPDILQLESAMARAFEQFTVSVTAPEASTSGATRALRHIILTSHDERVFIVGSLNAGARTAELRTLGYVIELAKKRSGGEPTFSRLEYLAFVERATWVLEKLGFAVTVAAFDRTPSAPPPARAKTPTPIVALLVACGLMLAGTASWMAVQW